MALLTKATAVGTPGEIRTIVPAGPGWRVLVTAPDGTDAIGRALSQRCCRLGAHRGRAVGGR